MGSKCFAYCVLLEDQVLTSYWGQQGVEEGCPYCAMQSISRLCLPVRLSLPALLARLWKTTWFLGILLAQVTNDKTSVKDKFSLIQKVDLSCFGYCRSWLMRKRWKSSERRWHRTDYKVVKESLLQELQEMGIFGLSSLCYLMSCSESMKAACVPSVPGKVAHVNEILWRSSSSATVCPKQLCDFYLLGSVMSSSCCSHSPLLLIMPQDYYIKGLCSQPFSMVGACGIQNTLPALLFVCSG